MIVAWIRCPDCEECWCTIHKMHAFECPCPPIEEWKTDPYGGEEFDADLPQAAVD